MRSSGRVEPTLCNSRSMVRYVYLELYHRTSTWYTDTGTISRYDYVLLSKSYLYFEYMYE